MNNEKIETIIASGYQFNMSKYINTGVEIFNKNRGGFIGFTVIYFLVSIGISAIPVVGSFIGIVVQPPMVVGFYIMAKKLTSDEPAAFNDFFSAFSGNISQLALNAFIGGIMILLGFCLLILPGIYLAVGYGFSSMLVYFKGMEFWAAMETSRKIISKEWFSFLGFFLVLFLINILGAICLGIGLLVTVPISFCALYAAFDDIVGVRDVAEQADNITQHFVTTEA